MRYDATAKLFLPLLPGVYVFDPPWSADGKWVVYTTYPDHTLWRSRSNGTDLLQLTFAPGQIFTPSISPDGERVVYVNSAGAICLINMDGASAPTVAEKNGKWPHWSPDGNLLVFTQSGAVRVLDLRTGTRSQAPASA